MHQPLNRAAAPPMTAPAAAPKAAPLPAPGSPPPGPGPAAGNGIQWSLGAPAAIPSYPLFPQNQMSQEFANASQNAPIADAERSAQLEQAKAAAIAADDTLLQRLLPAIRANPQLANSPQLLAQIEPILARRGLALPREADGSVDPTKLTAMLSPAPTMTPAEVDQMYNSITTKEKALGTGGYTPQLFLADIKSARQRLADAGMSTAPLDEYLSADGTQLSDSFINSYVGQKADEEIQHLKDLGIHIGNEDAYRKAAEAEKKREFDTTTKLNYARLDVQEQRNMAQISVAQQRLQVAQGNLSARWAGISDAQQRFQQQRTNNALQVYKALLGGANKQMDDASNELQRTRSLIETMAQNPSSLNKPEVKAQYEALVSQATALQSFIQQNGPTLQAEINNATQGISSIYTNISGNPSATADPSGQYGQPVATDSKGRPVYKNGAEYVYGDGTVYTPPKQ